MWARSGETNLFRRLVRSAREADKWLIQRLAIAVSAFFLLFILLVVDFSPEAARGPEIGQPSPVTVAAPRALELVDDQKTQALRRQAAKDVDPIYRLDGAGFEKARAAVDTAFEELTGIVTNENISDARKRQALAKLLPARLLRNDMDWLMSLDEERLRALNEKAVEITSLLMIDKIDRRELEAKREEARRRGMIMEDRRAGRLAGELAAAGVRVNNFVDRAKTDEAIAAAVGSVEPVTASKLPGETIVTAGEIVTPLHAAFLEKLGLAKTVMGRTSAQMVGQALISFFLVVLGLIYIREFQPRVYRDNRLLLLLFVVLLTVSALAKGLAPLFSPFLIPAAGGAMLTTILVRRTTGIMMAITTAMVTGIIVNDAQYWVFTLLTGLLAVYLTSKVSQRSDLTRAGLWLMAASSAVAMVVGLSENISGLDLLVNAGWGALGGFGATILTIGTLQFLEHAFNVTTDMKLLELANPMQPLLKELMVNAPGTYNHSIMTGNLVESVAQDVGANPLLARAGAYYHDIGKTRRPFFFVENQYGDNPHDKTQPNLSYLIISAHVKEGIELARKYRLPQEIIDIIGQHHGTTLVSFFYSRAKETEKHSDVTENQFRYQGEKPESKEAALIMLADSVEAAVRALPKPTRNRIEQTVRKIIKERMYDGQLDHSDLTLRDLETIARGYTHTLATMYHSRIEYPEIEEPTRKRGVVVGHIGHKPV